MEVLERIGPIAGTGAAAILYTAGAGERRLLEWVHVANTTGSDQTFILSIGADAAGVRLASGVTVPTGSFLSIPLAAVIFDGETIQWNGPTTLTLTAMLRKPD